MHGSYTHRVTCNLYPEQYFRLQKAARKLHSRLAPFVREAALAYVDQRRMLPYTLDKQLRSLIQEIRRVGTNFNQIAKRANSFQRLTHDDLRRGADLIQHLERQVSVLRTILEELPQSEDAADAPSPEDFDADQVDE